MIVIDHTIVSDEIRDIRFCCDLDKCLGAWCVEGDAGAPLEEEEISMLEDGIDEIKPFMHKEGIEVIDNMGVFDFDAIVLDWFALSWLVTSILLNSPLFNDFFYINPIVNCGF